MDSDAMLRAVLDGVTYPAEPVAGGAAYELFSDAPAVGFLRLQTPGRWPYHRFVPTAEVTLLGPAPAQPLAAESTLQAPLAKTITWEGVHRLSQSFDRDAASSGLLASVRASAVVRRGTRMIKPLSAQGVAGMLRGALPHGFCYREWDVAHLRTPAELAVLSGGMADDGVAYVLRWRALDPIDYQVSSGGLVAGLAGIPPHDRIGGPIIGTGFAPSRTELIPEWLTADLADLPLPAHASLVAYPPDGTEVILYTFQPEQRGWLRLVGPQWRHLLAPIRDVSPDQEYVPVRRDLPGFSSLVGTFRGEEYPALADPPDEFRVLAMNRAARYPVDSASRRTRYARWRGEICTVLAGDTTWTRLRLCQPTSTSVAALGAQCYERGVYEVWAPTQEVTDVRDIDVPYPDVARPSAH